MCGVMGGLQLDQIGVIDPAVTIVAQNAGDLAVQGRMSQRRKEPARLCRLTMRQAGVSKRVPRAAPSCMAVQGYFWMEPPGA